MAEQRPQQATRGPTEAIRVFEQPPDSISFYCDYAQILGTEHEVVLQFYESIPGPPVPPGGAIANVRTRMRATVVVSQAHAENIGRLLLQRIAEHRTAPVAGQPGKPASP